MAAVQVAIQITAIHLVGGTLHQHIASVRWRNNQTGQTGQDSRENVVNWLRASDSNTAFVSDGQRQVRVGVVNAHPPYLRTHADGVWTDNLLALPRF